MLFVVAVAFAFVAMTASEIFLVNLHKFIEDCICQLFAVHRFEIQRLVLFVVIENFIDINSALVFIFVFIVIFKQTVKFSVVLYARDLQQFDFFSLVVGKLEDFFFLKNFHLFFFVFHFILLMPNIGV